MEETEMLNEAQYELLMERIAELELALEDRGWLQLVLEGDQEFSREGLRKICKLARIMWLKNPLIRRGVDTQTHYVFGQGVNITAHDEAVNEVVQQFLNDAKNQAELTSLEAMQTKERELQILGNLFFVFFINRANGRVRVRTIPVNEIDDIICNPDDAKEPWFYQRSWTQVGLDGTLTTHTVCYPDWRYTPRNKPKTIRGHPVAWDTPVYHVKVNALSDMRFGVSEVYSAIDWARAYKNFLEDWATLTRAYSRFAHKMTVPGGAAKVAAAKSQIENAGRPVVGSTFIAGQGVDLTPVRIGGANVKAEDGRRILLMVAAAVGLPESFFGDVSVGTLATAKSLDRPTELKMRARQTLWGDVFQAILQFVVVQAVRYGDLPGRIVEEDDGTPTVVLGIDPETGEQRSTAIDIQWPPILEHDVESRVKSIVSAATLGGAPPAGTIPDSKYLARLLLTALGEQDVDALIARMFPDEPTSEPSEAEAMMTEAVRELRDALRTFIDRYSASN